jgi:hypothetical protein
MHVISVIIVIWTRWTRSMGEKVDWGRAIEGDGSWWLKIQYQQQKKWASTYTWKPKY